MSLVNSTYKPTILLRGQHLETMVPGLFRKVVPGHIKSERVITPDDDFLDLDWYFTDSPNVVIISHGLEGNSRREYMVGMANRMNREGYTAVCWNYRGCSERINNQLRMYHSGATDDLDLMVKHVYSKGYEKIALIGFSLGGNLTMKYIGEQGSNLHPAIKCGVVFSVPLDLAAASQRISGWDNYLYELRFLKKLAKKIRLKHEQFPDKINLGLLKNCRTVWAFDNIYTGPLHGFNDAMDYYMKCSSINFLQDVHIPSLIVNAKNDPFLPIECYPFDLLKDHHYVRFEAPEHGGHVGFFTINNQGAYWSEDRAVDFISNEVGF